jgi:hypothetical protein
VLSTLSWAIHYAGYLLSDIYRKKIALTPFPLSRKNQRTTASRYTSNDQGGAHGVPVLAFGYGVDEAPYAARRRELKLTSVRLAGPRRFGKTRVLNAHVAAMRAVGHGAPLAKCMVVADNTGPR